ncbi:DNA repair protein complementing XP-C cells like [Schistosoma japonicum]|nr:DNA repair protein complementing XP-C cells like [Schistosoma japonicum]
MSSQTNIIVSIMTGDLEMCEVFTDIRLDMSRKKSTLQSIGRRSKRTSISTSKVDTISQNNTLANPTECRNQLFSLEKNVFDEDVECGSISNNTKRRSKRISSRMSTNQSSHKITSHFEEESKLSESDEVLTDVHFKDEGSDSDSSDFVSQFSNVNRPKSKKKENSRLLSKMKPKNVSKRITKPSEKVKTVQNFQSVENDSDDETEWVEVNNETPNEIDFMHKLLNSSIIVAPNEVEETKTALLTVAVPVDNLNRKHSKQDPELLKLLALKRKLKEHHSSMHSVHVLCFLAHSRVINRICDSSLCRALGVSLLANTSAVYNNKTKQFIKLQLWSVEHVEACLVSLLSYQGMQCTAKSVSGNYEFQLVQRLSESKSTEGDCIILLVAALRLLGFDVRIILGLNPLPLLPSKTATAIFTSATKETKNSDKKKQNRKIISSDEEDIFDADFDYHPYHEDLKPNMILLAEIFLPKLDRWVCIDPSSPTGVVDKVTFKRGVLYVVGACSVRSTSPELVSYVGRNPVDLSPRYVEDWCVSARAHRIPVEKWDHFLDIQSKFFDKDAVEYDALVSKSDSLSTFRRDRKDADSIHEKLLSEPLPKRMQDFKNHPLYVLQRHLLKFQVIYPPDSIPLGYFRNEPVYSRDCLHLCHTRESWLKEAMTVRLHEKPAKIVKARLSMKRKLLQGSDSTPPTVEVFGPWQVEPYVPPKAENGVVPRNAHGNVELFKPCMLPVGCAHLCLSGIQYIARRLGIDCAEAVVGWTFHGAGWAHPSMKGYVVCKESVPILIDAWRTEQMNAAKLEREERTERVLNNWKRLVRGLFIWHRVKAQFALAPLYNKQSSVEKYEKASKAKCKETTSKKMITSCIDDEKVLESSISLDIPVRNVETEKGWMRLGTTDKVYSFPKIPEVVKLPTTKRRNPSRRKRKTVKYEETSSEASNTEIPSSKDDSADEFVEKFDSDE